MRRDLIIAGALILVLAAGGAMVYTRRKVADALWRAFEGAGLPGAWGEAIGRVESGLSMAARNLSGTDGARGGAWGPTQITEKTARAYGYTGPMDALNRDLDLAASLSAKIAAAGRPMTIQDLGAWWNAGKRTFDALPADHVTRTSYVPRLLAALSEALA